MCGQALELDQWLIETRKLGGGGTDLCCPLLALLPSVLLLPYPSRQIHLRGWREMSAISNRILLCHCSVDFCTRQVTGIESLRSDSSGKSYGFSQFCNF